MLFFGRKREEKREARRSFGAVSFDTSRGKITQSPADEKAILPW
jgi:hypothetical protein